jgi:hypothetical protein
VLARRFQTSMPRAGAAGILSGAAPRAVSASGPTKISALFARWETMKAQENASFAERHVVYSDEEVFTITKPVTDIEDAILDEAAQEIGDFVLKARVIKSMAHDGHSVVTRRRRGAEVSDLGTMSRPRRNFNRGPVMK